MRIVAIMTMTFLPGTFFAALFAIPSLDWKDDPIVTSKFWVYWAFTIPSTVAIFNCGFFSPRDAAINNWLFDSCDIQDDAEQIEMCTMDMHRVLSWTTRGEKDAN